MYRQYENPAILEEWFQAAKERLAEAEAIGADPEELITLKEDVEFLRERTNFAWQDEEEDW